MKRPPFLIKQCISLVAFAALLAVVTPANSWALPPQDSDTTRQELAGFDGFMDSHPEISEQLRKDPSLINNEQFVNNHPALQKFLQQHPGVREEIRENPNAFMRGERRFERSEEIGRRGELATLDRFLDGHPELSKQLRKDPSLVNNKQFLESHPELQEFLQQHSGVREQLAENPSVVMRQEERFDRREDFGDRDRDQDFRDRDSRDRDFRDNDVTRGELANMDRFLDSHPEIAEQLRKDPSLINNQKFAKDHPALQEFLQQHPGVREEFTENPRGFMRQEERFDRREDFRELASLDRFLDDHPVIDEQLRKDPSLVDNKQFVANHPDLRQYLQEHPAVRQDLLQNPNAFMKREGRFDRFEASRDDGGIASFHEFMGNHAEVAQQISKNPSLAQNEEFLENHAELQQFLKAHPEVQSQLRKNPEAFVRSAQQFSGSTTTKTQIDPKLKK